RDGLTPAEGMVIYNTDSLDFQGYSSEFIPDAVMVDQSQYLTNTNTGSNGISVAQSFTAGLTTDLYSVVVSLNTNTVTTVTLYIRDGAGNTGAILYQEDLSIEPGFTNYTVYPINVSLTVSNVYTIDVSSSGNYFQWQNYQGDVYPGGTAYYYGNTPPEQIGYDLYFETNYFSPASTTAEWINLEEGPQGPAGAAGNNGATGSTGAAGNVGATGSTGAQGVAGPTGAQGPIGLTGATGAPGTAGTNGSDGATGLDGQGGVTTAGTNVTITGTGTVGDPYVVNATGGGSPTYTIGLWPELGGYVFWVSADGKHGLVAETQDQGTATWYEAQNLISNPSNHSLNGQKFRDWRMPTKHELNEIYLQQVVVGGFATNFYWSSTEYASSNAWVQFFTNGYQTNSDKNLYLYYVRSVRAF
ncbi:MAG: hypothetical protein ACI9LA_000161, partial [Bacteroidia bacterium]